MQFERFLHTTSEPHGDEVRAALGRLPYNGSGPRPTRSLRPPADKVLAVGEPALCDLLRYELRP
jgi:hypothetical protein